METIVFNQTSTINSSFKCNITYYDIRVHLFPIGIYSARFLLPIITIVGIFGNIVSFIIWISPKLRRDNSSAIYLAVISISDLLLLCVGIVYYFQTYWYPQISSWFGYCEFYFSLYYFLQYNSIPLVFAFTLERWVSICYPFARERIFSPKRSYIAIGIIIVVMYVQSLGHGIFNKYNPDHNECSLADTKLGHIRDIYASSQEAVVNIFIPLCILVLNILVIRELHRITKASRLHSPAAAYKPVEREVPDSSKVSGQISSPDRRMTNSNKESRRESASFRATTIMLLSVSFYLIISVWVVTFMYLLQTLLHTCDEHIQACLPLNQIKALPDCSAFITYHTIKMLIDIFGMTHFASNFFIYFITGKNFRDKAIELLWITRCGTRKDRYEDGFTTVTLRETNVANGNNTMGSQSYKLAPKSSTRLHRNESSQIGSMKCEEL